MQNLLFYLYQAVSAVDAHRDVVRFVTQSDFCSNESGTSSSRIKKRWLFAILKLHYESLSSGERKWHIHIPDRRARCADEIILLLTVKRRGRKDILILKRASGIILRADFRSVEYDECFCGERERGPGTNGFSGAVLGDFIAHQADYAIGEAIAFLSTAHSIEIDSGNAHREYPDYSNHHEEFHQRESPFGLRQERGLHTGENICKKNYNRIYSITDYIPVYPFSYLFMKHTKQILAGLVFLSLSTSAFAAETVATPVTATGAAATTTTAAAPGDALNVPGAPSVVSQTATSVTLQWPKVAAAKTYVVKYSKTSVAQAFAKGDKNASYELETDQVTSTGTTISSLKTDTSYFFTVVALDAANNESTTNSEELAVKLVSTDAAAATGATVAATATGTTATGATAAPAASSLKLTAVNVMNDKTISVDFSAALSKTPVTVKVTKSSDTSTVAVTTVTNDPAMPNRVIVNLASALSPSSSYSIVVIDAADQAGLPIAEGVNAVKEFATAATLAKAAGSEVVLNAAPESASGAVATATAAGQLPATGTQENLILLVAALLALGIVYGIQKKRA